MNELNKRDVYFCDLDFEYLNAPLSETLEIIRNSLRKAVRSLARSRSLFIVEQGESKIEDFVEVLFY